MKDKDDFLEASYTITPILCPCNDFFLVYFSFLFPFILFFFLHFMCPSVHTTSALFPFAFTYFPSENKINQDKCSACLLYFPSENKINQDKCSACLLNLPNVCLSSISFPPEYLWCHPVGSAAVGYKIGFTSNFLKMVEGGNNLCNWWCFQKVSCV